MCYINKFIAGRFTLVKSVLLVISNYFMQTMRISKEICEEIERLARQFIGALAQGKGKWLWSIGTPCVNHAKMRVLDFVVWRTKIPPFY